MTERQKELRDALLDTEINPSWQGYGTLRDMLYYFCSEEGDDKTEGMEVVADRIMDIIKQHI